MKITTNSFQCNITEPFGFINIISEGTHSLKIICEFNENNLTFYFNSFLGFENRNEFFDHDDAKKYEFNTLGSSHWNYPVSWIPFEEFKDSLSSYELTLCTQETKLWFFLSMTNFVLVFSNEIPLVNRQ